IDGVIHRVVSNRKAAYGLTRARAAGIETRYVPFKPYADRADGREAYDLDLAERLNADHPDLIVLAGWMRILSAGFLATVNAPVINLHPALPGAYPGTNAIERAWHDAQTGIITETGVMVHRVIEEVDAGTVLGTTVVPIDTTATFATLEMAIHKAEHALLVNVVAQMCRV
ncbi:MAG: phosphoribosylglycinamide formyltransferase, partial [Myxococcota bacterium]|nr:phosphoribosylglycinamide formyltransferase [Myxococcota bacterium]